MEWIERLVRRIPAWAACFLLAVVALSGTPGQASAEMPAIPGLNPPPDVRYAREVEDHVLRLTNQQRAKTGLAELDRDGCLSQLARAQSTDMLVNRYVGHVNTAGQGASLRVGIHCRTFVGTSGENVWTGSGHDVAPAKRLARLIMDNWMQSPGHRANILRPDFNLMGVGVVYRNSRISATQVFGGLEAWLDRALPTSIRKGETLSPDFGRRKQGIPVRYGLRDVSQGTLSGINEFGEAVSAKSAMYRTLFYFVTEKRGGSTSYKGVPGPVVVIR